MTGNVDTTASRRITIGYIAGAGHSGSTLADLLLGSQPGIASFGEIKMLDRVRQGSIAKGRCTCGNRLDGCPIWGGVLTALLSQRLTASSIEPEQDAFVKANALVFEELAYRTGQDVIIDSSKSVDRLHRLLLMPRDRFEVRVIHLVRDGRAVAYSNARKGRSFSDWIEKWQQKNLHIEAIPRIADRYVRVKYEDLVADPPAFVSRLLEFLEVQSPDNVTLDWTDRSKHNIGGNRMRRSQNSVIAPDNDYLAGLSDSQWRWAEKIAGDLLRRYGYEDCPPERVGRWARRRNATVSLLRRVASRRR